jgi:hypothetical protein
LLQFNQEGVMSAVSEAQFSVVQQPMIDDEASGSALSPEALEEVQALVDAQLAPLKRQIAQYKLDLDAQGKYAARLRARVIELETCVGTLLAQTQLDRLVRQFERLPTQVQEQKNPRRRAAHSHRNVSGPYSILPRPANSSSSSSR